MTNNKTTQVVTALTLGVLLVFFQNCSDGGFGSSKVSSNTLPDEILDPGEHNQKPHLTCVLTSSENPAANRQIDSDSRSDTFTEAYLEGSTLSIDCAQTSDETTLSELSFRFSNNYSPSTPNLNPIAGSGTSFILPSPGRFPMAFEVEDAQGLKTLKTFTTVVRCADGLAPTLDTAGVTVSASSRLNYFNYSIDPAALGNGSEFFFSWDFNGDSVYDPYSLTDRNNFWTDQASLSDIYTIFANQRKIGLKVRNECQLESYFIVDADFPMVNIPRNPTAEAVAKPYYYLQADLSSEPAEQQRTNGDYLSTMYPEDVALKRIDCDYNFRRTGSPAGFTMKGHNWYKPKYDIPFLHGMQIHIKDINDSGATGTQVFTDAVMDGANYKVSAADDGIVQESYNRSASCSLVVRIERLVPQAPCADDKKRDADFSEVGAIVIRGEFDCPQLSENGKNVAANNGKFYCEVAPVDMCVGGGGGGGTPPPEQ